MATVLQHLYLFWELIWRCTEESVHGSNLHGRLQGKNERMRDTGLLSQRSGAARGKPMTMSGEDLNVLLLVAIALTLRKRFRKWPFALLLRPFLHVPPVFFLVL